MLAAQSQSQLSTQGQVVLANDSPIPGFPGAVCGGSGAQDNAVMDHNGTLLFRARFTGGIPPVATNGTDDRGLFLGRASGDLQMLVRSGQPELTGTWPGALLYATIGTLFGTGIGGSPRISPENGYLMFGAQMTGGSIVTSGTTLAGRNDSVIYYFDSVTSTWQILAQRGGVSPAGGSQYDTSFNSISYQTTSLNSSGTACFQATLVGGDVSGTTNNFATFVGTPGNLQVVQRKGDTVVLNTGSHIVGTIGSNCILNRIGQVLHDESLSTTAGTPPATAANNSCVFVWDPGTQTSALLVREGDQAPGMPTGALMGTPTMAQGFDLLGQTGIATTMTGAVTTADDTAIFLGGVGTLQKVAREGDQAPGLAPGVLFGSLFSTFAYSDYQGGTVAFYAALTGAGVTAFNDQSFWVGTPSGLQMLAREGDPAPGFAGNVGFVSATFGNSVTGSGGMAPGSVQLNNRGQVVFNNVEVTVIDGAGTRNIGSNVYSYDPTVGLQLLFGRNDAFTTVSGTWNGFTTGGIQFPSGDGCPLSLNNDGDVTQRVSFDVPAPSGSGAIVRAKIGPIECSPSSLSATFGGAHPINFDAGIANAGQIYVVVANASGTRPGIFFGGQPIPLNQDQVFNDSISGLNPFPGTPWGNTLGVLDANGRGGALFTMPPGFPALAGIDLHHVMAVIDLSLNVLFVTPPCGCKLY